MRQVRWVRRVRGSVRSTVIVPTYETRRFPRPRRDDPRRARVSDAGLDDSRLPVQHRRHPAALAGRVCGGRDHQSGRDWAGAVRPCLRRSDACRVERRSSRRAARPSTAGITARTIPRRWCPSSRWCASAASRPPGWSPPRRATSTSISRRRGWSAINGATSRSAHRTGARSVLVRTGYGRRLETNWPADVAKPTIIADNLLRLRRRYCWHKVRQVRSVRWVHWVRVP